MAQAINIQTECQIKFHSGFGELLGFVVFLLRGYQVSMPVSGVGTVELVLNTGEQAKVDPRILSMLIHSAVSEKVTVLLTMDTGGGVCTFEGYVHCVDYDRPPLTEIEDFHRGDKLHQIVKLSIYLTQPQPMRTIPMPHSHGGQTWQP